MICVRLGCVSPPNDECVCVFGRVGQPMDELLFQLTTSSVRFPEGLFPRGLAGAREGFRGPSGGPSGGSLGLVLT